MNDKILQLKKFAFSCKESEAFLDLTQLFESLLFAVDGGVYFVHMYEISFIDDTTTKYKIICRKITENSPFYIIYIYITLAKTVIVGGL